MAVVIGSAGRGGLLRGLLLRAGAAIVLTIMAAMIVAGLAWTLGRTPVWWIGLLTLLAVAAELYYFRATLFEGLDLYREGGNWLKGAEGERLVAAELARLPDDYIVFHDFHPVKSDGRAAWNIDHLVIGPTGVYVIETKNYSSRAVSSAESSKTTLRNVKQAQRNAYELKRDADKWSAGQLGELFVVPVVVYAQQGAHVERLREGPTRVLPLRLLVGEILSHRENSIDMDRAARLGRVLYDQIDVGEREPFSDEIVQYGRIARQAIRDVGTLAQPESVTPTPDCSTPDPECPKCGRRLIVRTARRGSNAGNTFWACPGYPACKHTQPVQG